MNISKTDIHERWESLPEALRDAVFSDENDSIIYELVEKYKFSENQERGIGRICFFVFLGFLRIKDVFEELVQNVKLDSKTALEVYQELEQKVFGPYKDHIEKNYRAFQENFQQEVAFPKTQKQVVLKSPIAEEVVNLKTENKISSVENAPAMAQNTEEPTPAPLDALGKKINVTIQADASDLNEKNTIEKNQFATPTPAQEKAETTISKPESQNAMSENAPFILHKHEEVAPVARTQAQHGYRQMSFGSFMGAFKAPQTRQQQVSQAQVEIPSIPVSAPNSPSSASAAQKNISTQQVPFSIKKYEVPKQTQTTTQGEAARVVHYTFEEKNDGSQNI